MTAWFSMYSLTHSLLMISFDQVYEHFSHGLEHIWMHIVDITPKVAIALIIFGLFILMGTQVYRLVLFTVKRRAKDPLMARFIARIAKWILILGGVMFSLEAMGFTNIAGSLLAGAGISAFVVGFALKDIGENLLAGLLLAVNRQFHTGDVVKVDDHTGMVMALNLRNIHLRTVEGNDVYVPNAKLINSTFINVTATGPTREDFVIGIDYYDDIDKAMKVIVDAIKDVEGLLKEKPPFVNVDNFNTDSVLLRVYYWYNAIQYEKSGFYLGSLLKKLTKEALMKNGFYIPGRIHEHMVYRKAGSFPVDVRQK